MTGTKNLARVREHLAEMAKNADNSRCSVDLPIPFSRASIEDFGHIVELWNGWISDEKIATLPTRACPACGSEDGSFLFRSYDQYPFHICNDCRAWYVPYQVSLELIERFFSDCPEAGKRARKMAQSRFDESQEADQQRFDIYFDLIEAIRGKENALTYFDVGCGVGHSLGAAAKRGWNAMGIDHNAFAIGLAREAGLNAKLPDEVPAEATYDLISLFETLEHLTDPGAILSSLHNKLASEGLLILTIPTKKCWELALLKQQSLHIFGGSEEVGHINLLDIESLERLLHRSGFSLCHAEGQFTNNYNALLHHLLNSHRPTGRESGFKVNTEIDLPTMLVNLINGLDIICHPLDQLECRSPILIAIACRSDTSAKTLEKLKAFSLGRKDKIRAQLDQFLPKPAPTLATLPGKPLALDKAKFTNANAVCSGSYALRYRSTKQNQDAYIWHSRTQSLKTGTHIVCRGRLYAGEILLGIQQNQAWVEGTIVTHQDPGIFELVVVVPEAGKFEIVVSRLSVSAHEPCHVVIDCIELNTVEKNS